MVNYSDISQLVRDVTELVRKSRDAELIAKATEMAKVINELVVENIELENRLNEKLNLRERGHISDDGRMYWVEGEHVTYCSYCFEVDGILKHMIPSDYGWVCERNHTR